MPHLNLNIKKENMAQLREIYFAGGCFWGTEHFFKQIRGVEKTEVGYANGKIENPTYEQVRTNTTGFAETVRVFYHPETVTLKLLLELFFKTIDPTSMNRQGEDVGTQYRTGVYYIHSEDRAVIEVEPLQNFYNAEDYHQDYLDKNEGGYCHIRPELFKIARDANR